MKYLWIFIVSFLIISVVDAQQITTLDSLKHLIAETKEDTVKTKILLKIASNSFETDSVEKYANLAFKIAQKTNDKWAMMVSFDNLGWAAYYTLNFEQAVNYYKQCELLAIQLGDKRYEAIVNSSLGNVYYEMANNTGMWDCYRRSLKLFTELNDTANICYITRNIGQTFCDMAMYQSAYTNFFNSLDLNTINKDSSQMSIDNRLIGETMLKQYKDDTTELGQQKIIAAKNYMRIAEQLMPKVNNDYVTSERSANYINLADCYILIAHYTNNHNYIDSSRYYLNKFKNNTFSDQENFMITSQTEAEQLIFEQRYQKAISILQPALDTAVTSGSLRNEMTISQKLYKCYLAIGNNNKALETVTRYYSLKQKFASESEMMRSAEFQSKMTIEREKEAMEADRLQQQIINEAEKHRQKIILFSMGIVLLLLVTIVLLILKALRQKRRSNEVLLNKNIILEQQKEEIATQNDSLREKNEEIENQRDMLSAKNQVITKTNNQLLDSITYAYRIQRAVISTQEEIDKLFPNNFVFYSPRDIVSGDFYRVDCIREHKIIVVADCTGHGVPGALLSMMGISALKDILWQIDISGVEIDPTYILEQMRFFVKKTLNQSNSDSQFASSDGMDMSVCVLNPDNTSLLFAGANQSVVLVHNQQPIRLKGEFMPVGYYIRENPFTTQTIPIEKGDMLYLFSDGIQDQVGGPEHCKYSVKRLCNQLALLSLMPTSKQMNEVEKNIALWIGQNTQLDDITLIGIQI